VATPGIERQGGMTWIADNSIEIGEPLGAASPVWRFLDRFGGGVYSVDVQVDDVDIALERAAPAAWASPTGPRRRWPSPGRRTPKGSFSSGTTAGGHTRVDAVGGPRRRVVGDSLPPPTVRKQRVHRRRPGQCPLGVVHGGPPGVI
jgi:hypothetical protein